VTGTPGGKNPDVGAILRPRERHAARSGTGPAVSAHHARVHRTERFDGRPGADDDGCPRPSRPGPSSPTWLTRVSHEAKTQTGRRHEDDEPEPQLDDLEDHPKPSPAALS